MYIGLLFKKNVIYYSTSIHGNFLGQAFYIIVKNEEKHKILFEICINQEGIEKKRKINYYITH